LLLKIYLLIVIHRKGTNYKILILKQKDMEIISEKPVNVRIGKHVIMIPLSAIREFLLYAGKNK
jgi:hypothetical protein